MFQGPRTVVYPSPDLVKAKAWYARVLGIEPYFDEPFYVGFRVGGFELGLIPDGEPGGEGGLAYWGVAEITAALERAIEMGATPHEGVAEVGGGIKTAAVLDPFGNVLGLIENPGFDPTSVR